MQVHELIAHYAIEQYTLPPSCSGLTTAAANVLRRYQVHVIGDHKPTLLFCNGLGCSQDAWHYLVPALAPRYQLVFFDQIGISGTDLASYDPLKYSTLAGYAQDVVDICQALCLHEVTLVGHSVGGMIALLAVQQAPGYFTKTVMLEACPCHFNEPGYYGGIDHQDLAALLTLMDANYHGWAHVFAEFLAGPISSATLGEKLVNNFCAMDSKIAKQYIRVALLTDMRPLVSQLKLPTLLLQSSFDAVTPAEVGDYLLTHLPAATLIPLPSTGHFPHLNAPLQTLAAMQPFLAT
jgi:sigma-B regulation protein RsbQ